MNAAKATEVGLMRGKQIGAYVANEGRVEDDMKLQACCDCALGVDDIYCLDCLRASISAVEANGRQDEYFCNGIAAEFNRESMDPSEDSSVLWDAYEEGLRQGIDEVTERMVPADKLMTMAMRAASR